MRVCLALSTFSQLQGQVVEVTLREMFMKADTNKDGKISMEEVDQLSHINDLKLGFIRDLALAIHFS